MKSKATRKTIVVAVIGIILASAVGFGAVHLASTPESDFARLIRLAYLADTQYDNAIKIEGTFSSLAPRSAADLEQTIKAIVGQFGEEGILFSRYPTGGVGFADFGEGRSVLAGIYSEALDQIALNERYLVDPAWSDSNYLEVLVHELTHAQGFLNESQTEATAIEVTAALANLGNPGYLSEFWDGMRRDALATAFYIATYRAGLIHTTDTNNFQGVCLTTCADISPDPGQIATWMQARTAIFTPEELRRADKRLRFFEDPSMIQEYRYILVTYVNRPLTAFLDVVCLPDPHFKEQFSQGIVDRVHNISHTLINQPLQVDDTAYLLRQAGFCN